MGTRCLVSWEGVVIPARVLIYTFIMVLLWGSHAAVAAKTMASGGADMLSPHGLLFFKLLIADACLFVILLATGRLRVLRSYSGGRLARLAFAGMFGYFIYYFCYFRAVNIALPQKAVTEAAIINYLFPMCTMLASAALIGERLTLRALVAAVVAFAGAFVVLAWGGGEKVDFKALLSGKRVFTHLDVDLLALVAAVSWGIFSALGRRWRHEPLTGMFIFITTGLVLSGIVLPFTSGRAYPVGWEYYGCFHVGFLCNTLGVILWFLALRHGGAALVGNLSLLASFFTVIIIRLLIPGETLSWSSLAGLALIVLGALFSRKVTRRVPAEEVPEPPA